MRVDRIAIPTNGYDGLDDKVSDVFSRAETFTIVEYGEDNQPQVIEVLPNKASTLRQGAGPIAAKNLKDRNVTHVICGELGPGASTLLKTLDITTVQVEPGIKVSKALMKRIGLQK